MPTIPVSVDFKAEDHVSSVMQGIIEQTNKLTHAFDHMSEVLAGAVGIAGGLAAAFGFHHMIEETKEQIAQVSRLKALTGLTAESADALNEAFELSGISAEDTTNILSKMSLQALRMEDAMMGIGGPGGGAALMQRTFANLGVDLRRGTVPSLLKMAEQVQKGHLGAMNLRLALRLSTDQALALTRMLRQGPEKIREQMEELKRSGTAISEADIESMARMRRAAAEISSAWRRITVVVGKELLPVIAKLMEEVAKRIKGWIEPVQAFGRFLAGHLRTSISLALTLGKIMLANAALMKLTGAGLFGRAGLIARGVGLVRGAGAATEAAASGAGIGATAAWIAGLLGGTGAVLGLAAAAWIAVEGLEAIATNAHGIRSTLFDAVDGFIASLGVASDHLDAAFPKAEGLTITEFVKMIPGWVATGFMAFLEGLMRALTSAFDLLVGSWTGAFFMGRAKVSDIMPKIEADIAARKAAIETARKTSGDVAVAKKPGDQNFYNSHFEILQKFEEGFDPDRIITAFTNDLAALGERGIQSGFQPAYVGSVSKG